MPTSRRSLLAAAFSAAVAIVPLASPAAAQGGFDFRDDGRRAELVGPGVGILIPDLRESRRARVWVMRNFDFNRDGILDWREARAANRAFLQIAGADRSRFDWDHPGERGEGPPPREHHWDRQAMRNYHFRQGRYGAMFTMQDVLFETASAELRPGAVSRLSALADYLGGNPNIRIRIDGHTDSVGSDAANEVLSRNRARSVGRALAQMGVGIGRITMEGHGEAMPVASNDAPSGRQLNRRVEVSLIGVRASSFN